MKKGLRFLVAFGLAFGFFTAFLWQPLLTIALINFAGIAFMLTVIPRCRSCGRRMFVQPTERIFSSIPAYECHGCHLTTGVACHFIRERDEAKFTLLAEHDRRIRELEAEIHELEALKERKRLAAVLPTLAPDGQPR